MSTLAELSEKQTIVNKRKLAKLAEQLQIIVWKLERLQNE